MTVGLAVTGAGFASTPDHASLGILGDIDIRVWCALTDWDSAVDWQTVIAQWDNTLAGTSWMVRVHTGVIQFAWSNGAGFLTSQSTAAFVIPDGTPKWIRVAFDADNGSAGNTATFYTSDDGTNWAALGAPRVTATVATINNGTALLTVGGRSDNVTPALGRFYKAEVRNGIGGTIVANPDFRQAAYAGTTITDSTDKVWTRAGVSSFSNDGSYDAGSEEALQGLAQRNHRVDLNGAMRSASGIAKGANGIAQQLWGSDLYGARDQAWALLGGT